MEDLTVIFLTNNKVPEGWAKYHRAILEEAIGDCPIITISRQPMDWGTNLIQTEPESSKNIYWQILRGAKLVKTPYLAIAEDDTLYTRDHFTCFRHANAFAYNAHRWSLYTWNPIYSLKTFIRTNAVLIAPAKLVVETLEERYAKYPNGTEQPWQMEGEMGVYEKEMGLTPRKLVEFKSHEPVIQLDHDYFTVNDPKKHTLERRHQKRLGTVQAIEIPVWGRAEDVAKKFS